MVNHTCPECGNLLKIRPSWLTKNKNICCSYKCARDFRRKHCRNSRICKICGEEFSVYNSEIKKSEGKFCSVKCFGKWMSEKNMGNKNSKGKSPWIKGQRHKPETIEKMKAHSQKGKLWPEDRKQKARGPKPPGFGLKVSLAVKGKKKPKLSVAMKGAGNHNYGKPPSYKTRLVLCEFGIGGIWYGNVRYPEGKIYCEKWRSDLWRRIDAAQGYQSILSGKTKLENNGHALSRHHVYWQEKACCVWDEDAQGYYAMINLGTAIKPNWYKHYIKGDPNKFVLLTSKEHGMIKGSKKLGTNKLTWIKILEDLIETKLDGKCYLTKEEMKVYSL
jgi:hypothetical protein